MKLLLISLFMISFSIASAQNYSEAELANKEIITNAFHDWQEGTGNFFDLLTDDLHWEITDLHLTQGSITPKRNFWIR